MTPQQHHLRRRVYFLLEHPTRDNMLSILIEVALIVLIIINVIAVALETVGDLYATHHATFLTFDIFSVSIFTIEYIARVWASAERDPKVPAWKARLRYMRSYVALIDLLAILPFYLGLFFPIHLEALRVLRLLRVYKLSRYSPAHSILLSVIREEAGTLLAAFSILAVLLVLVATGAYFVERNAQPEHFGSIPAAMWWALVTLTTVGYGDVTPITSAGRVFGGLATVLGIGMAALPAGILSSGLADHIHRRRDHLRDEFRVALEDGKIDIGEGRQIEELRRRLGISREIARNIHEDVRMHRAGKVWCRCPNCGHAFDPRQHRHDHTDARAKAARHP